jgi:LysR family hydrogen peroxide-inducible transcriptional activator
MNFQQIDYLLAINKYRSFSAAAKEMFVTQPALTIQIKNLEEELGVLLFDRNKKPLEPTAIGKQIIEHARFLQRNIEKLADLVSEFKAELSGKLKIGIIPTVSPYLVPIFVNEFIRLYPDVQLEFKELITEEILSELAEGNLDAGIIVTPFPMTDMIEFPLYYEKFFLYVSELHPLIKRKTVRTSELNLNDLWLLEEGNCFRNQVINICTKDILDKSKEKFSYESLSIDSLRKIVDGSRGITVIPELSAEEIPEEKKYMVKKFKDYQPVREVTLIVEKTFLKKNLVEKLAETIKNSMPKKMLKNRGELISTVI